MMKRMKGGDEARMRNIEECKKINEAQNEFLEATAAVKQDNEAELIKLEELQAESSAIELDGAGGEEPEGETQRNKEARHEAQALAETFQLDILEAEQEREAQLRATITKIKEDKKQEARRI